MKFSGQTGVISAKIKWEYRRSHLPGSAPPRALDTRRETKRHPQNQVLGVRPFSSRSVGILGGIYFPGARRVVTQIFAVLSEASFKNVSTPVYSVLEQEVKAIRILYKMHTHSVAADVVRNGSPSPESELTTPIFRDIITPLST